MGDREVSGGGILAAGMRSEPAPQSSPCSSQDDEEVSEFALDGLKQVMAVKSRVVLPYLVPKVNLHTPHTPQSRGFCACAMVGLARYIKELRYSFVFQDVWEQALRSEPGSGLP